MLEVVNEPENESKYYPVSCSTRFVQKKKSDSTAPTDNNDDTKKKCEKVQYLYFKQDYFPFLYMLSEHLVGCPFNPTTTNTTNQHVSDALENPNNANNDVNTAIAYDDLEQPVSFGIILFGNEADTRQQDAVLNSLSGLGESSRTLTNSKTMISSRTMADHWDELTDIVTKALNEWVQKYDSNHPPITLHYYKNVAAAQEEEVKAQAQKKKNENKTQHSEKEDDRQRNLAEKEDDKDKEGHEQGDNQEKTVANHTKAQTCNTECPFWGKDESGHKYAPTSIDE